MLVEYLELFDFHDKDLLVSLREFLSKFTLKGETQEQDRILQVWSRFSLNISCTISYPQAFANRYAQCNSGGIFSAETAHKIVYAIILLNTDLYINSANGFKKMELEEFLENTRGALHE